MILDHFEKYRGQGGIHSFVYSSGPNQLTLTVKYTPGNVVDRPLRDQILADYPSIIVEFVAEEAEVYTNMDIFDRD